MSNIYIYPKNDYATLESPNPYILNLEIALSKKHNIINKKPNTRGVLDMIVFLFKADIFFLNWIENLTFKRFGKFQTIVFFIFIHISKFIGKKVIWVIHNIYSHEKNNMQWTKVIFKLMMKKSDLIITHSIGGIDFINEIFPKYVQKVKYIIHPVEKIMPLELNIQKKYDLFIWGTIYPYKGIIEFLDFVKQTPALEGIKILISGICPDSNLKRKLYEFLNNNIIHIDKFLDIDEIGRLANQSKFVIFTYNSDSVLSSGSLMDSIRMGSLIIGPDKGAFKDLSLFGIVKTYKNYNDIVNIIENQKFVGSPDYEAIKCFCLDNSWEKYEEKIFRVGKEAILIL